MIDTDDLEIAALLATLVHPDTNRVLLAGMHRCLPPDTLVALMRKLPTLDIGTHYGFAGCPDCPDGDLVEITAHPDFPQVKVVAVWHGNGCPRAAAYAAEVQS